MRAGYWRLLFGVALLALAGCGGPSLPAAAAVTSAQVQRMGGFPANNIPAFSATITDAAKTQEFYSALLALPPLPSGTHSCPADFGVTYHVAFFAGSKETLDAVISAGGCGGVVLSNPKSSATDTRWWARSDTFWQTFAYCLGVPESEIYPVIPNHSATPTP